MQSLEVQGPASPAAAGGAPASPAAAANNGSSGNTHASGATNGSGGSNSTALRRQVSNIDLPVVKTNIMGASSNLVNSIVGAGIIGIPFALNQAGLLGGSFLLILVCFFTDKSLRMIVELASFHPKLKHWGVYTFEDLMKIPFGIWGLRFVLAAMLILAYGAMVAYLLIIKDSVPTVLGMGNSFVERELVMLVTSVTIMVPLSMMRDISQLAFTSTLSVLADIILVMIVCGYSPIKQSVSDAGGFGNVLLDKSVNHRMFIGLGVLSTAMACQHSAFLIAGTLEQRTAHRWSIVTGRSLAISGFLTLLMGITGYLGYLGDTQGDVLNNFDPDSRAVNAGRSLLAITMFFTYPMESFVARHVLVQLFFGGNMDNPTVGANGELLPENKLFGFLGRREIVTLGLYLASLLPALIVDDLGPVLSLTGSLGASAIAYIAPGLVYIGVNGDHFLEWTRQIKQRQTSSSGSNAKSANQSQLPVEGDATATMEAANNNNIHEGGGGNNNNNDSYLRTPWWWCLVGMPLWESVARTGNNGTRNFLSNELQVDPDEIPHGPNSPEDADGDGGEVIGPRTGDYIYSIVLILFGIIAMIAGVGSNIYAQVHDAFYTP